MTADNLKKLLRDVAAGKETVGSAYERLRALPFENIGLAHVDHHREIRQGVPEVILGEWKSAGQIVAIARSMRRRGAPVLITRLDAKKRQAVRRSFPAAVIHAEARCAVVRSGKRAVNGKGSILVVTAGTSDIPVAEEAAVTAEFLCP